METYIVRVYRRGEASPSEVVGVIQCVESGGERAFRDVDEVARILGAGLAAPEAGGTHEPKDEHGGLGNGAL